MPAIIKNETGADLYVKSSPKSLQTGDKNSEFNKIQTKISAKVSTPGGFEVSGSVSHAKEKKESHESTAKIISSEFKFSKIAPGAEYEAPKFSVDGNITLSYLSPGCLLEIALSPNSFTIIDKNYNVKSIINRYVVGTYEAVGNNKIIKGCTPNLDEAEKMFDVCKSYNYTATIFDRASNSFIKNNTSSTASFLNVFGDITNYLKDLQKFVMDELENMK